MWPRECLLRTDAEGKALVGSLLHQPHPWATGPSVAHRPDIMVAGSAFLRAALRDRQAQFAPEHLLGFPTCNGGSVPPSSLRLELPSSGGFSSDFVQSDASIPTATARQLVFSAL